MTVHEPELIEDDVVVVNADWAVSDVLDLIAVTDPAYIVVRRSEGRKRFVYIKRQADFAGIDQDLSVMEGLGLSERQADNTIPAHASLEGVNRPTVVVDRGAVRGVVVGEPPHELSAEPPSTVPPQAGASGSAGGDEDADVMAPRTRRPRGGGISRRRGTAKKATAKKATAKKRAATKRTRSADGSSGGGARGPMFSGTPPPPPPRPDGGGAPVTRSGGGQDAATAGPDVGSPIGAGSTDQTMNRHLSAELPQQAAVGDMIDLLVTLGEQAIEAMPDTSVAVSPLFGVAAGTEVDLILSTRSGVEVVGPGKHKFQVTADSGDLLARFQLKAVAAGPASMRLMAFVGPKNVANLALTVEVGDTPAAASRQTVVEAVIEEDDTDVPDLMLLIYEYLHDGEPTFRFQVHGTDPALALNMLEFEPVTIRRDPEKYFSTYFSDIEALLDPGPMSPAEVELALKVKGTSLYEEIVPDELREKLWAVRNDVRSVLIQSTDPWVPWEMCYLSGPDENGAIVDHGYVCEHYDVARWIQGERRHQDLSLEKIGLVVTGDSQLPAAIAEGHAVEDLRNTSDAGVVRIDSSYLPVYEAFCDGSYTGFHFTGHGLFAEDSDSDRTKIVLESHIPFRAENISGPAANLGKGKPIVFLNACQVGRSGLSLADAGGWARAVIEAGAGAFVGAHWSVLDDAAGGFSRVFYERLLEGDTIAAAVRKARLSVRQDGDPTWLAYVLYADPAATVSQRSTV